MTIEDSQRIDQVRVFVDRPRVYHNAWGPFLKGSCHMFARLDETEALHALAARIGLKRAWFQGDRDGGHYDLTVGKHAAALKAGAVELTDAEAVAMWRENRETLRAQAMADAMPKTPQPCIHCTSEPDAGPGCSCAHAPCIHDRNAAVLP